MESVNISRKYEASKTDTPKYFGPDLTKKIFKAHLYNEKLLKKIVVLHQAVQYNEVEKKHDQ